MRRKCSGWDLVLLLFLLFTLFIYFVGCLPASFFGRWLSDLIKARVIKQAYFLGVHIIDGFSICSLCPCWESELPSAGQAVLSWKVLSSKEK